jgi:tetratricopeptide (TPR) repeat protein
MRKIFLAVLFCSGGFCATAQPGKQKPAEKTSPTLEANKKVYKMAQAYGDALVAVNSLYYIIAEEGEKSEYKDTLAITYFSTGAYEQCAVVAADILQQHPLDSTRLPILEILALSQTSLGKTKEAIESFEMLLAKTQQMLHAYRLAEMQFNFQRVAEALQSILLAETLKNSLKSPVNIDMGEGKVQPVRLEAAVQNLKGYILLQHYPAEKSAAIAAFKKALELQPDFVLAKNNLDLAEGKSAPQEK